MVIDMDFDSAVMEESPPSSPIVGYSGDKDDQNLIEAGVVYCFNCKGPPRPNDNSFSPEGYILRREVTCALENLNSSSQTSNQIEQKKPRLVKFFGSHNLDPLEKDQVKILVALSRKNIASLEILSEHAPVMNSLVSGKGIGSADPEDILNQNPWVLRKNVCIFLNYIVRQLKYYRQAWTRDDFDAIFLGLKKSLGSVKEWSGTLKSHCGFRSGNACTAAQYHFFHLQLELRWSLLLIFGLRSEIVLWVLDDLVQLGLYNYTISQGVGLLDNKQPFNCMCVKEMWTMIRLIIEELKPQMKSFWNFCSDAFQRCNSDVFFPIWMSAHLAQTSRYSQAGVYTQGFVCQNNGFDFLRITFKEWAKRGGKSAEILRLSFKIFSYWGGDHEVLYSLWCQWTDRLDSKGVDVSNLESYSTVENWLKLITKLCDSVFLEDEVTRNLICNRIGGIGDDGYLGSNNDPFLEFVRVATLYASSCSEKDLKRLKSSIFMKLCRLNTAEFGELGIIRTTTLVLCLISAMKVDKEAISLCERLQDLFQYAKVKDTPGRRKAVVRAYSCSIILLLKRNIKYNDITGVASNYMKVTDELMAHDFSSSLRKDLIMIYIHFLECLPKHTPNFSSDVTLGRNALISPNLLMWLSHCGQNYALRTIRALCQLTEWIAHHVSKFEFQYEHGSTNGTDSNEAKALFIVIKEKCLSYIRSAALAKSNRIPATDLEPLACLAGDLTFLSQKFDNRSIVREEERSSLFELLALNTETCPIVSQFYVERLFVYNQFAENCVLKSKWTEVWLRLIFLNCTVPQSLTYIVLGSSFASTSNEELLSTFSDRLNEWVQTDLQKVLTSVLPVIEKVMNGTYLNDQINSSDQSQKEERDQVIHSVIKSCTILLKKFDTLYIKGFMKSCGHQYLENLVPNPLTGMLSWERFSMAVMKSLESDIYSIFLSIVTSLSFSGDTYLFRKLEDIIVFTFFGFAREDKEVDSDEHPLLKMLNYCEDYEVTEVQNRILPEKIAGETMTANPKLREIFLKVVQMLRAKRFPTLVLRVLPGVIRLYPLYAGASSSFERLSLRRCLDAVFYCCMFGSTPVFNNLARKGFEIAFEKDFNSKGKSFITLCLHVAKKDKTEQNAVKVRNFIQRDILPLIHLQVEKTELKRGHGEDRSLRNPLALLEVELQPT